jgi:uncharacterized ion transporter superfamily protein YfcC
MVIFVITGTYTRTAVETMEFYELIITDFLTAGYNALSAVALNLLGAGIDCLGNKDTFDAALNQFARAYTDQTE